MSPLSREGGMLLVYLCASEVERSDNKEEAFLYLMHVTQGPTEESQI